MTCWWEFFDSKDLSHLRLEAYSNEIHQPKQMMSDVPNWFCPWVVFALPFGTVIIGEHGIAWQVRALVGAQAHCADQEHVGASG